MNKLSFFVFLFIVNSMNAQEKPYYYEIPAAPEDYSANTVAARLVDGLGFRYFWATEGLREEDLRFKPSEEARTSLETIQHIYGLTRVLLNTTQKKPTSGGGESPEGFTALRAATLENIRQASDILRQDDTNLEEMPMIFQGSNGSTEYPFWNLINGPVSDALWHVGQVVTFRRSSGNPLPKGVRVLQGTKTD
ncbi:MAG: hypothetical protein KDC80_22075 [Saprospiraceae bacterium]|nr:hypothetical protein [Saprospiraceae bacterium]